MPGAHAQTLDAHDIGPYRDERQRRDCVPHGNVL
jgi:hypothetical protein